VVFYGTLEGYMKAVNAITGKELYKFKTPSGIIGNVMTYEHVASSTLPFSPVSAVGRASALRPVCCSPKTPPQGAVQSTRASCCRRTRPSIPRALAPSVATPVWRPTPRLAEA
jgi:hypothetical protein